MKRDGESEATVSEGRVSGLGSLLLRAALAAALGGALPALAPPQARAQAASDSLTVTFTPRDVWPPAPVTDLTALPGAEGQLLLQWTAPDSNGDVMAVKSAAAAYRLRVATFSAASVGGSTTTWWSLATDVQSLPAPADPATLPAPAAPGSAELLLLTRLAPGVTYYAMLVSEDQLGQLSDADTKATSGAEARALVFDANPPTPGGLTVTQTGRSTFTVTFGSVNAYDLDFYRLYVDSTSPYDFANGWIVSKDSPTAGATLSLQLTGLSTGTYHFRLSAVDMGAPDHAGIALESALSGVVVAELVPIIRRAQTPFGVALTTAGFTATLRWMPTTRYEDGEGFLDPAAPTADELTGYRVYRATTPTKAAWTEQAQITSTATLTWTDLAGGPQYYYHVKSENATALSRESVIRAAGSKSAWVVAPDGASSIEVFAPHVQPVEGQENQPMTAYLIETSSHPEEVGGRVIKSIEFKAWQGGVLLSPNFKIPGKGMVRMHYELGPAGTVTAQGFGPLADVAATPENMSVYWYNGSKWLQLYGDLDAANQIINIESPHFGRYQLRTVERPQAFNFNQAGVSNRLVTPNGDGKNDAVVFTFDNPRDSEVNVRILDVKGRTVAGSLPAGPVSNSKTWDGTAGGRPVPGGVYIYQIESEGKTFTGTIVIIR